MPETWVEQVANPDDVDLKTVADTGNVIEVRNVNVDAVQRIALKSTNTNNGASSRALYTEGQVELVAGLADNPAITAVKVYNPSTNNTARALAVTGRGNIGVQLANDQDDADKQALNVMGNTHMQSYTGVNAAHKTLHVVNSNANANARALKVEGKTELDGELILDGHISGIGGSQIDFDDEVHMNEVLFIEAGGESVGEFTFLDDVLISGQLTVGPGDAAAQIDARSGAGPQPYDINLGTGGGTEDVTIGRNGQTVTVNGSLVVGAAAAASAKIDAELDGANARDLRLGAEASTKNVYVCRDDRDLRLRGETIDLGLAARAHSDIVAAQGSIEANPDDEDLFLRLGVRNDTLKVVISNANADPTLVQGDLDVQGDIEALGEARIGPAAAAGVINSGGSAVSPQHLQIGGNSETKHVELSRSGQMVDMKAVTRLNGNAMITSTANSITDSSGNGFLNNATGHGNGASIDVYIGGSVVGWMDSTGFVKA